MNWFIDNYEGQTSWIEVNNDRLNGCNVQDLLCPILKNETFCDEDYCFVPCNSGACDRCMTNCESCNIVPHRWDLSLQAGQIFKIPVPANCQNPSLFFQNSDCGGTVTYDSCYSNCLEQSSGNPEQCKENCLGYSCCLDSRGCGNTPSSDCVQPCSSASVVGKTCRAQEVVILKIADPKYYPQSSSFEIIVNGQKYTGGKWQAPEKWWDLMIIWYGDTKPFPIEPVSVEDIIYIKGIPSEITVNTANEGAFEGKILAEKKCCYECSKNGIAASILYPKVDIEQLSIAGGPTVIKDGKVVTSFTAVPGIQEAMIQVENRGFFTQNKASVVFQGLPEGITFDISPSTQKIKAQNIATYSATFTVGPNVPSGTYKVTMIAYYDNGVFDTVTIDLVVP